MRLSDYVMRFIAAQGVRHVFLVTGGGAMHLNASLAQCPELEPVCNSHEQASAMAAESYSKATNNLGVALVTTGPGGTNALTGVTGAWLDSTPVLVISGQVKRPDRKAAGMRQLGVQEVDIVSIAKPVTKYAVTVLDPSSIRYHLEKAVWLARNGRPGPVWVDIPLDVQASPIDEANLPAFDPAECGVGFSPPLTEKVRETIWGDIPLDVQASPIDEANLPAFDPAECGAGFSPPLREKVRETIEALNRAQRPLIFVGNGVRLAHAEDDFRRLFARLGIPVEATWCAADIISSEDPLFVGRPGSLASRGANFALQNCDFLLIVGARMDFAITGYAPERLARAAHKVMVDIDPAEIRKLAPYIQTEIPSDAGDFLREMLHQIDAVRPKDRTCWNKRCADWKTRYPVVLPEHRASQGRVSIFYLAEVIGQETSPEDIMISGSSGSGIEIFLFACPARTGQRIYHMAGLGSMGCGIPMSIGACLAGGRRRAVCVDGDGGFQFNIQELATVRRLDLPIKFFVFNNDGYASIRASQTAFFGSPQVRCDERTGLMIPPLAKLGEAYNIPCIRIATQDCLREQVRQVLNMPGPVLCDVEVIPDEPRVPRLSSMQRPDGSLVSKPLEDLFPFLSRDEFYANTLVSPLEE
jgi:acetolactate synthase-1/2/3 large subunit